VYGAVDGGFISVANDRVSILSEHVALGEEIDAAQARLDLESAQAEAGASADYDPAVRLAQARLDAAVKAS
jgi:F-type H+-transporting ATPase subunit epsilon